MYASSSVTIYGTTPETAVLPCAYSLLSQAIAYIIYINWYYQVRKTRAPERHRCIIRNSKRFPNLECGISNEIRPLENKENSITKKVKGRKVLR